jgi:hypothetical protein
MGAAVDVIWTCNAVIRVATSISARDPAGREGDSLRDKRDTVHHINNRSATELRVSPCPKAPLSPLPHVNTCPALVTAAVCSAPHSTLTTAERGRPSTTPGSTIWSSITPLRPRQHSNCLPQVSTQPSTVRAAAWNVPKQTRAQRHSRRPSARVGCQWLWLGLSRASWPC